MVEVIKAMDDRIDWLRAKYRDSEGEDRMYWKNRHNEATTIREIVLVAANINAKKGDATDIIKG